MINVCVLITMCFGLVISAAGGQLGWNCSLTTASRAGKRCVNSKRERTSYAVLMGLFRQIVRACAKCTLLTAANLKLLARPPLLPPYSLPRIQ
jgi:hypothetical protein